MIFSAETFIDYYCTYMRLKLHLKLHKQIFVDSLLLTFSIYMNFDLLSNLVVFAFYPIYFDRELQICLDMLNWY